MSCGIVFFCMFHRRRSSAWIRSSRPLWLACLLLCLWVPARAQETVASAVTFALDFPGSSPPHYVISISADGHASYVSDGKLGNDPESSPSDPWRLEFIVSPSTSARVFDLAKRAHYFEGEIDSRKKNLAFTGAKTLTYKDAQKSTHAAFNYSPVAPVQELTAFFQGLSATLEFGHRLEYYLRYQKLALDDEVKQMEEMSNKHELEELSAVAPVLQKIADDPAVMKVARARAQHLLQLAGAGGK
jgi:hypothetical protein